jgi:glycosyltransferase involved in cell wall biosynthesis
MSDKSISVVIPAYNEEDCLGEVIEKTSDVLRRNFNNFEILVVNDGSTDRTKEIAESIAKQYNYVRLININKNIGFGNAVMQGFKLAKKDLLAYIPADNQFDVNEIVKLIPYTDYSDIVLAYRETRSTDTIIRRVISGGFKFLFMIIFGIKLRDVNWIHLYKREVFDKVNINSKGVFFCGEVVVKAKQIGYRLCEVGTAYNKRNIGSSKNHKPRIIFQTFKDMLKVKFNLNNYYEGRQG